MKFLRVFWHWSNGSFSCHPYEVKHRYLFMYLYKWSIDVGVLFSCFESLMSTYLSHIYVSSLYHCSRKLRNDFNFTLRHACILSNSNYELSSKYVKCGIFFSPQSMISVNLFVIVRNIIFALITIKSHTGKMTFKDITPFIYTHTYIYIIYIYICIYTYIYCWSFLVNLLNCLAF